MTVGAEGGTRTPTSYLTRPSNVRVYQFRHFGSRFSQTPQTYFDFAVGCALAFDPVAFTPGAVALGAALVAGDAAGAGVVTGATVAAGDACGVGVASAGAVCKTERCPVTAGNAKTRAISMKTAAAPMVTLASSDAVPRGPNAVLETLLEKSAPASDFPGCRRIAITRTMHAKIKKPYKT
jgi:hypothetical protein